jgi:uncharacterized protein YjbJ (UPF0337 family)
MKIFLDNKYENASQLWNSPGQTPIIVFVPRPRLHAPLLGAINEGAGKLTGDKELETEGQIDKAKGSAHSAVGDVKDEARDATDAVKK